MKRGPGVDLWWAEDEKGFHYLSEARYFRAGKLHGFRWWLNEDQKSISSERHFRDNRKHGIERSWNQNGRLDRGYPRYWVSGRRVTKQQYLRECRKDATIPPFRDLDNRPNRPFPPEIKLRPRQRRIGAMNYDAPRRPVSD
jgi:hypothetical protein